MDHDESPELIEQRMQETRDSLTEKVAALETQVGSVIENATNTVQDTVAQVRSAVRDTVDSVKEGIQDSMHSVSDAVQDTLDVRKHVRENPWLYVGGAVAAGVVTGLVVFPQRPRGASGQIASLSSSGGPMAGSYEAPPPRPQPAYAAAAAAPAEPRRPGVFDELLNMVGKEVRQLGEMAIASLSASLKQQVNEGIPRMVQGAVERVGDAVTPAERRDPWHGDGARQGQASRL